jgi:hypothetical protein
MELMVGLLFAVLVFKTLFSILVVYFVYSIIRTHARVRRLVKGRDVMYWSFWTAFIWVMVAIGMPIAKQWSNVLTATFTAGTG